MQTLFFFIFKPLLRWIHILLLTMKEHIAPSFSLATKPAKLSLPTSTPNSTPRDVAYEPYLLPMDPLPGLHNLSTSQKSKDPLPG